jgi:hypothetical protein
VQRNFDRGNRDTAIPNREERGGDVARNWRTCISDFWVRGFAKAANHDIIYADFLIGKSTM